MIVTLSPITWVDLEEVITLHMQRTQNMVNGTVSMTPAAVKLEAKIQLLRLFQVLHTTYSTERETGMRITLKRDVISIKWPSSQTCH